MNPAEARLKRIVARGETTTTECKSELNLASKDGRAALAKRIIGLANACKRTSYVVLGTDDNGAPSGVDHTSLTEERLHHIVAECCEPFIDVTLNHIDIAGDLVSVIEIHRQISALPYRAAKTQGEGPILERGFVYYRYGRHTQKARYAEIALLEREGDKKGRGSSPTDEYRYLSVSAKRGAMTRALRRVLKKAKLVLPRRAYFSTRPKGRPTRSDSPEPNVVPAELTIDGVDYLLLCSTVPGALRANSVGSPPFLFRLFPRSPSHRRRLRVIFAHGSVGRPLKPDWAGAVVERESFGWYAGCSSDGDSIRIDAHLFLENVRSAATMKQAISAVLDWIQASADLANFLPDD